MCSTPSCTYVWIEIYLFDTVEQERMLGLLFLIHFYGHRCIFKNLTFTHNLMILMYIHAYIYFLMINLKGCVFFSVLFE